MFDVFGFGSNGYQQGQQDLLARQKQEAQHNAFVQNAIRTTVGSHPCKHCNGTGYSAPTNPEHLKDLTIEIRTK